MTKDGVLEILWENADAYISGAELARRLSLSRTAVWKGIEQLRADGYIIQSMTNKGYRLSSKSDVLSETGIRRHLKTDGVKLQVRSTVTSTNTVLKGLAAEGAEEGLVLLAAAQTQGRGRMGRSFYSPPDTGLYMSVLLRPAVSAVEAARITACAAVAVAEAIEALSGRDTQIKWVNDVLMNGKKVCGILTEASTDFESGMVNYVVVGIGVNTALPPGDFPGELRDVAGAAFGAERPPELRCRLAAEVLDRLMDYYRRPDSEHIYRAYRARSVVLRKSVNILSPGRDSVPAEVLDIDRDYSLLVRLEDGSTRRINSGEVSVRMPQGPDA